MQGKHIILILVLGFLTFGNSLFNGFVGDDHVLIVDNSFYKSLSNFPRLFQSNYIFDAQNLLLAKDDLGAGSVSYRPLDNATYFLDYFIWKLNPFGFHLTNMLIHLANMVLVYSLLVSLGLFSSVALFSSLLFGLHPIQSEAVCAIGYRADSIACLFVLLAMIFWVRSRPWLSILSYLCAVFCKESVLMFPLLILIYENFFKSQRRYGFYQLVLWSISLFYVYLYLFVFPNSALPNNQPLGETLSSHILGVLQIFSEYIVAFINPANIHLMPALYAPPVETSMKGIVVPILIFGLFLSMLFIRKRLYLFLVLWFTIFYIPISNIIPLANPVAYRFMYLPSIGFLSLIAIFLNNLFKMAFLERFSLSLRSILRNSVIVFCIVLTVLLNSLWHNTFLVTSVWLKYYPDSWKAQQIMGLLYFKEKSFEKAEKYFLQSIQMGGREHDKSIDYNLAMCYLAMNQTDRAKFFLTLALKEIPDYPKAHSAMAYILKNQKNYDQALDHYYQAIHLSPLDKSDFGEMKKLLLMLGRGEEIKQLEALWNVPQ
jgi:protein O-mannosyl-transferase